MKNNDLEKAGYNQKLLAKRRRKHRLRVGARYFVFLVLLGFIGVGTIDYLARLPRERAARNYSYIKRAELGFGKALRAVYLKLNEYPEDPKNTELPIIELFIKGKRLDKLNENLPESGGDFQKAKVKLKDKEYSASARFRGDSINHWAFPQKSWRISLEKGKFYEGMQSFNLAVPRVETQISNWLGYKLAENFDGLLTPHSEFVHFRLNRKFDGVRMLLEQPDQEFLRRRNLPYGKIFIGDINSEQIYGGVKRKAIYRDSTAWEVRSPDDNVGTAEIAKLVNLVKNEFNPYRFYDQLREIVDVDGLLQYIALLELVGSVHVDETHNGKFYFNPITGQFQPIVWDTVAYMWKNQKGIDLGTNSLFRAVLGIPEWREKKDRYLWNAINGKLSTEEIQKIILDETKRIRRDVYAFGLKLKANDKGIHHLSNEEWEASITELLEVVARRNATIKDTLRPGAGVYRLKQVEDGLYHLAVQVVSRAGVKLRELSLETSSDFSGVASIQRRGLEDIERQLTSNAQVKAKFENGKAKIVLGDSLYSKRRFVRGKAELVPATYVYEVRVPQGVQLSGVSAIGATNGITGEQFSISEKQDLEISSDHRKNIVWWEPDTFTERNTVTWSGKKVIRETQEFDRFTNLEIAPGTKLQMGAGASIVLNGGSLKAVGGEADPIQIVALEASKPWGVLAVRGGAQVQLEHVQIIGGSEAHSNHIYFQSALSLHNTNAVIRNSSFANNYLSVKGSQVQIDGVRFENVFPFHLIVENSSVREKNVEHVKNSPVHSRALRTAQEVFGTPSRSEREFKYSLVVPSKMQVDLDELAKDIQKALASSVSEKGVWKAPAFAGNDYYADEEAKDFAFRDIYFDTAQNHNYNKLISYRFRNRYPSMKAYKEHVKNQQWPARWPYRLEFQAKVNRKELGRGFSTVDEARFEFRKESLPFSELKLPPSAPWDLDEFVPYFQEGKYKGLATLPAKVIMENYFSDASAAKDLRFEPRIVLVTERIRQHLNIKSPWGSGPNPEQSYIISLDHSQVYDASPYLRFLKARKFGDKDKSAPPRMGDIVEIELEFERNVSDVLDKQIAVALQANDVEQANKLKEARSAFLEDQETIMKVIQEYFAEHEGLELKPAQKSKYVQAFEIAALSGLPKS